MFRRQPLCSKVLYEVSHPAVHVGEAILQLRPHILVHSTLPHKVVVRPQRLHGGEESQLLLIRVAVQEQVHVRDVVNEEVEGILLVNFLTAHVR